MHIQHPWLLLQDLRTLVAADRAPEQFEREFARILADRVEFPSVKDEIDKSGLKVFLSNEGIDPETVLDTYDSDIKKWLESSDPTSYVDVELVDTKTIGLKWKKDEKVSY